MMWKLPYKLWKKDTSHLVTPTSPDESGSEKELQQKWYGLVSYSMYFGSFLIKHADFYSYITVGEKNLLFVIFLLKWGEF